MLRMFTVVGSHNDSSSPSADTFGLAYRPTAHYPVPGHTINKNPRAALIAAVPVDEAHADTGVTLIRYRPRNPRL